MSREILHLKKSSPAPKVTNPELINQHKRMAMGLPISADQGKEGKGKKVKK